MKTKRTWETDKMRCFRCENAEAMKSNTLCVECSSKLYSRENMNRKSVRINRIRDLRDKIALCTASGWEPRHACCSQSWPFSMWPKYTPLKGYEQEIHELQRELGVVPDVPYHFNLCPLTQQQGKMVNALFEKVAGL